MTEDDAKAWLAERYSAHKIDLLEQFVKILQAEAERQSLIARSTLGEIWGRHIVDSAQLLSLAADRGEWLDIGSGGGLPGLVIAILSDGPVVLSEPRRMRSEFLANAAARLALANLHVEAKRVQGIVGTFATITARAVAPMHDILRWTEQLVSRETLYVLQRGRNWQEDVALTKHAWHGTFHVEQSITDPDAGIVLIRGAKPR